jgi:hypothetical protein
MLSCCGAPARRFPVLAIRDFRLLLREASSLSRLVMNSALVAAVSALCLIPRDVRAVNGGDPLPASARDDITAEPLPAVPG